jgi:hypothetical protein
MVLEYPIIPNLLAMLVYQRVSPMWLENDPKDPVAWVDCHDFEKL